MKLQIVYGVVGLSTEAPWIDTPSFCMPPMGAVKVVDAIGRTRECLDTSLVAYQDDNSTNLPSRITVETYRADGTPRDYRVTIRSARSPDDIGYVIHDLENEPMKPGANRTIMGSKREITAPIPLNPPFVLIESAWD